MLAGAGAWGCRCAGLAAPTSPTRAPPPTRQSLPGVAEELPANTGPPCALASQKLPSLPPAARRAWQTSRGSRQASGSPTPVEPSGGFGLTVPLCPEAAGQVRGLQVLQGGLGRQPSLGSTSGRAGQVKTPNGIRSSPGRDQGCLGPRVWGQLTAWRSGPLLCLPLCPTPRAPRGQGARSPPRPQHLTQTRQSRCPEEIC